MPEREQSHKSRFPSTATESLWEINLPNGADPSTLTAFPGAIPQRPEPTKGLRFYYGDRSSNRWIFPGRNDRPDKAQAGSGPTSDKGIDVGREMSQGRTHG